MEELSQNRQSSIFRDFEAAFAEGKLEYLRQLFLPYILNNIADLYQFKKNNLKEFAEAVGTQQLLQLYLYYKKMPLDMHRYMENQSESIKKEISNTKKERQEAVADWIKTNAERHRDLTVKSQCLYLEKIADLVIPPIEKALADYEKSQTQLI